MVLSFTGWLCVISIYLLKGKINKKNYYVLDLFEENIYSITQHDFINVTALLGFAPLSSVTLFSKILATSIPQLV